MPDGTVSACLTFDFDATSSWIGSARSQNPSEVSRGEFGVVGVERLLMLLARENIRGTFFIPGHTVCAYPDVVRRIADAGHEVGHHGWVHENPADFDRDGERHILEMGFAAFDRVLGGRPAGYRSPAWALSPSSVELLLEAGFLYESSCMGNDFFPYYLRKGDRWSTDGPYLFGETTELVEMPVTWGLDDFPHFELVPGVFNGLSAPSKVIEIWEGEFDYLAERCPGGVFNLTMHPQCIGRGHRMFMLERFIEHVRSRDARFEPLGAYAERWKAENPLEDWKTHNPERTGINAIEDLTA